MTNLEKKSSALRLGLGLVKALRPKQWTKNVLLYAGFLFTLNKKWFLFQPSMWHALLQATLAVIERLPTMLGAMDWRGEPAPYFFILTKES